MLEDVALNEASLRIDDVRAVGYVHQVCIQIAVRECDAIGSARDVRDRNPELHTVRLNVIHLNHTIIFIGEQRASVARVIHQHPETGQPIRGAKHDGVIIIPVTIGWLAGEPVEIRRVRQAAGPDEICQSRRLVRQTNPQIAVGVTIAGERVVNPVLLVGRVDRGQMPADLLRPSF